MYYLSDIISNPSEDTPTGYNRVIFDSREHGTFAPGTDSVFDVKNGVTFPLEKAPPVETNENYTFTGWLPSLPSTISDTVTFVAQYEQEKSVVPVIPQVKEGATEVLVKYPEGSTHKEGDTLIVTLPNGTSIEAFWSSGDDAFKAEIPEGTDMSPGGEINATLTESGKAPTNAEPILISRLDSSVRPIISPVIDSDKTVLVKYPEGSSYEEGDTLTVTLPDGSSVNAIWSSEDDAFKVEVPEGTDMSSGGVINAKLTEIGKAPTNAVPETISNSEATDYDGSGAATVSIGDTVIPENIVFSPVLPEGATVESVSEIDTTTAGEKTGTATVKFSDGSTKQVRINVTVLEDIISDPTGETPVGYHRVIFNSGDNGTIALGDTRIFDVKDGVEFPEDKAPNIISNENHSFNGWNPTLPLEITREETFVAQYKQVSSVKPIISAVNDLDSEIHVKYPDGSSYGSGDILQVVLPGDITVDAEWNPDKGVYVAKVPEGTDMSPGNEVKATLTELGKAPTDAEPVIVTESEATAYTGSGTGTVSKGDTVTADDIMFESELPAGATVESVSGIDTATAGEKTGTAKVQFADGSVKDVPIVVTVLDDIIDSPTGDTPDGYHRVTFSNGTNGSFVLGEITKFDVKNGITFPLDKAPKVTADDNYTFTGWLPELPSSITEGLEFVAQYEQELSAKPVISQVKEGAYKITVSYPESVGHSEADMLKVLLPLKDGTTKSYDAIWNEQAGAFELDVPEEADITEGKTVEATLTQEGKKPTDAEPVVIAPLDSSVRPVISPVIDSDKKVMVKYPDGTTYEDGDTLKVILPAKEGAPIEVEAMWNAEAGAFEINVPDDADMNSGGEIKATLIENGKAPAEAIPIIIADSQATSYKGQGNATVYKDETVTAADIIFTPEIPEGFEVISVSEIATNRPGDTTGTAKVKFPDGSIKDININVTVIDTIIPNPEGDTPEGYHRITFNPGDHGDLIEGAPSVFDVKHGTTFTSDRLPYVITHQYYKYNGWSPSVPAIITEPTEFITQYIQDSSVKPLIEEVESSDSIISVKYPDGVEHLDGDSLIVRVPLKDGTVASLEAAWNDASGTYELPVTSDMDMSAGNEINATLTQVGRVPTDADPIRIEMSQLSVKPEISYVIDSHKVISVSYPEGEDYSEGDTMIVTIPMEDGTTKDVDAVWDAEKGAFIADVPEGADMKAGNQINAVLTQVGKIPTNADSSIILESQATSYNGSGTATVNKNSTVNPEQIVFDPALPEDSIAQSVSEIDTTTAGEKAGTAKVKFADGSTKDVPITVTVLDDIIDNPTGDTPAGYHRVTFNSGRNGSFEPGAVTKFDVKNGVAFPEDKVPEPTADDNYTFTGWLPEIPSSITGSLEFVAQYTQAASSKPVISPVKDTDKEVLVKYPEGSAYTEGDTVKVTLPGDVEVDAEWDADKEAFVAAIPEGTDMSAGGEIKATLTEVGKTPEDAEPVTVTESEATAYTGSGTATVSKGDTVSADDITFEPELPAGAAVESVSEIDTTTAGEKAGTAKVKFADGSTKDVPITVTVLDDIIDNPTGDTPAGYHRVTFNSGRIGSFEPGAVTKFDVKNGVAFPEDKAPKVTADDNYTFTGWLPEIPSSITDSLEFVAQYEADDITAPEAPKVDPVKAGDTEITGTAEPNSKVEITLPDGTVLEGTADDEGNFSIPVDPSKVPEGGKIKATAEDSAGNKSPETEVTIGPADDITAPDAPKVDPVKAGDEKITGTAEANSKVEITLPDGTVLEGTADDEGNFSIPVDPSKVPEGGKIKATSEDSAGNKSPETEVTIGPADDVTAPEAPKVDPVKAGDTKITGTAEANSKVEITLPDGTVLEGTADDEGNFSIPVDPSKLPEGGKIKATSEDSAGNKSPETEVTIGPADDITAPDAPKVDPVKVGDTKITGTAEANSKVEITLPDGTVLEGTADEEGNFSIPVDPSKLPEGGKIKATSEDSAGNKSPETEVTIGPADDVTAPDAPKVDPVKAGDEKITGTAEANSKVEITLPDGTVLEGTADGEGNFSIPVDPSKLPEGGKIKATAEDSAGNKSPEVSIIIGAKDIDDPGTVDPEPVEPDIYKHKLYMLGYPDGTVKPDGNLTRAEAAALFSRLLENTDSVVNKNKAKYNDISDGWYVDVVNYVTEKGIMQGYPDGTFKPDNTITRAEFTQMIANYDSDNDAKAPFTDISGHWAEAAIDEIFGNERIEGYPDGTFRPDRNISRAESAKIFNHFFERGVDKEGLKGLENPEEINTFTDLQVGHWGYYYIVEATNNHDYTIKANKVLESWIKITK